MNKKILFFFVALFFMNSLAHADWSVSVTWKRSTGPNLAYEECRLDKVVKCKIMPTDVPECQFNLTELKNQIVEIVSYNTQGANNGFVVGPIFPAAAPATNGFISTHWFNPNMSSK